MHYLRWAKVHSRARHELTGSGVPHARPSDLGDGPLPVSLEVCGTYGDPALIEAISGLYGVDKECVVPVPGASSANFIALAVAVPRGECVIVERPVYDPFERVARFLRLEVLPIERRASTGFGVDLDRVEAGLRQGAKALVLTNLHNPSGQWLSREAIMEIAALCAHEHARLIVDEAYLDGVAITGRGSRWTAAAVAPNVVTTSTLTKVYGLGGLRVGWLIAASDFAERARDVMDLLSVVNAAPATSVALHALSHLEVLENRYRGFYSEGQAVFRRWLRSEPLVRGYESFGAVFECVGLPSGVDGTRLNDLLMTEYDTQVVPGRFFGCDDHIRIGIALPAGDLAEGLSRVSQAIRQQLDRET